MEKPLLVTEFLDRLAGTSAGGRRCSRRPGSATRTRARGSAPTAGRRSSSRGGSRRGTGWRCSTRTRTTIRRPPTGRCGPADPHAAELPVRRGGLRVHPERRRSGRQLRRPRVRRPDRGGPRRGADGDVRHERRERGRGEWESFDGGRRRPGGVRAPRDERGQVIAINYTSGTTGDREVLRAEFGDRVAPNSCRASFGIGRTPQVRSSDIGLPIVSLLFDYIE